MGKGAEGKVQVSAYHMSMQVGVCAAGEGLQLLNIKMGEKLAWEGPIEDNNVYNLQRPNLFGGPKKEGGLNGLLWWLNGNPEQTLPEALAQRLGKTAATCPGYRGFASFFLTGHQVQSAAGLDALWTNFVSAMRSGLGLGPADSAADVLVAGNSRPKGFYLCSNNPYVKTISARVRRAPQGLNPSIAMINLPNSAAGRTQRAANPAHMVFEVMTNTSWGMGESYGAFNIGSFEDCAQTLFDENFGLCMLWTRQSKIEDFVKEVLDHIQGAVFVDPATGKHTMKLLRGDYDPDDLPQITPDNAKLISRKRVAWGEIANEVVVTWTNPETGKEATVTAQDLAAIASQGSVVSTSRNYHGVASQALAQQLAERDLAAVVHPLMQIEVEVTREFWKTVLYDVVEVAWPRIGIESAIFRVSSVTAGSSSRTVKLSIYEDVFSLESSSYLSTATGGWTNPSLQPAPLVNYYLGTAPAFMFAAVKGLEDPGSIVFPQAMSLIAVAPNSGNDIGMETITYGTNVVGDMRRINLGERGLHSSWGLLTGLPAAPRSTIDRPATIGRPPEVGDFVLIGSSDVGSEICVIRSMTAAFVTLDRGLLDTTPKAWPAGTRAFIIPDTTQLIDETERSVGEVAQYHFLARTSLGQLALADAPLLEVPLTNRAIRPLRPANVQVGTTAFGSFNMGSAAEVPVTWSNRNREDESTQALLWTNAGVTPEAGQTTTIQILNPNTRAVITQIPGIEGESHALPRTALNGISPVIVRVIAVRNGTPSIQGHEITLNATF